MIILDTNATQQIKFIPREYNADKVVITNEDTNTSVEYTGLTFTKEAYYFKTDITFSPLLKKGTFYVMNVENSGESIYRDRIFCTDQTPPSSYTINEGEYIEHETTNEYIVLWQMIYS